MALWRQALQILLRSLLDLWENLFTLVVANLIWAISLIPGFGLTLLLGNLIGFFAGLLVIGFVTGPVTIGLYVLTVTIDRREKLDFGEFGRGIRRFYRRGWLLGFLNVIFIILSVVNFSFYTAPSVQGTPLVFAAFVWAYFVFTWFVMQLYLWPLAVRMEDFSVKGLFRNAILATFKYPALTLILGFALAAFFLVSYFIGFLPLMLFGIALNAIIGNKALSVVVEREEARAARIQAAGGQAGPYQVDVPPLPEPEPEPDPTYTTRNPPPGVKRRGSQKEL